MPTKLKPTMITRHRGETKIIHSYVKCASKKELLECVNSNNNPKRRAKALKELDRRERIFNK